MKFLITARNKDAYFALPPEKREEIVREIWAFVERYRKAGKLKDIFYTPDLKGAVAVWDLASAEDSARVTLDNPGWAFQDVEVQPLIDLDDANKVVMDVFAQRAKK